MTLAIAHNPQLDPFIAWQAANGAAWCGRMAATITAAHCDQNRHKAYVDCRCNGCSGLDKQTPLLPPKPPALALILDADRTAARKPQTVLDISGTDDPADGLGDQDKIIDDFHENPASGDDFDDVEVDLEDEMLLALFPELAEDPWPEEPRFSEYQTEAPRRAVYHGRCQKCGGWVEDTRERHDDNVFHCLSCGWRTSPEYQRNRAIQAAGE